LWQQLRWRRGVAGIVLLFALLVRMYTRFVRRHPEYPKTHVASGMILMGHLQTLSIIGSLQLGWPLVIQEILASISLQLMDHIPLPCILTNQVLKALLLVGAWLVARRRLHLHDAAQGQGGCDKVDHGGRGHAARLPLERV
jgi:hypothetical protein